LAAAAAADPDAHAASPVLAAAAGPGEGMSASASEPSRSHTGSPIAVAATLGDQESPVISKIVLDPPKSDAHSASPSPASPAVQPGSLLSASASVPPINNEHLIEVCTIAFCCPKSS
jgi:hypothetical protein